MGEHLIDRRPRSTAKKTFQPSGEAEIFVTDGAAAESENYYYPLGNDVCTTFEQEPRAKSAALFLDVDTK